VTAALRVTDGAVVVVDCVEKVCVQTETVLRQALNERIRPMLFLNKLDRPFIELKRTSEEMYQDFRQVIESVNVIVSQNGDEVVGNIFLDPVKGNVVFGSGYQQWAFTLERFAEIWAPTFKQEPEKLKEKLWGEWRFDKKGKKWTTEEQDADGQILNRAFCQFIIDPIYKVINFCIEGEIEKLRKFLDNMKVTLTPEQWELRERKLVKVALQHWIDASSSLMNCIALHLPSPKVSQKYRCPLLYTGDMNDEFAQSIMRCDPKGPLMMYVSKMIPADKGRFFAYGRVFSGTIASGDKVFIMENYNPDTDKNSLKEHAVTRTVLIMGAKSEPIADVPCGNTVGLQGIDKFMIKTGTITNNKDAYPLKAMK
jgi:elongation factor 2